MEILGQLQLPPYAGLTFVDGNANQATSFPTRRSTRQAPQGIAQQADCGRSHSVVLSLLGPVPNIGQPGGHVHSTATVFCSVIGCSVSFGGCPAPPAASRPLAAIDCASLAVTFDPQSSSPPCTISSFLPLLNWYGPRPRCRLAIHGPRRGGGRWWID